MNEKRNLPADIVALIEANRLEQEARDARPMAEDAIIRCSRCRVVGPECEMGMCDACAREYL